MKNLRNKDNSATNQKIFAKKTKPDFAFILHALSRQDLMRVPGLGGLRYLPENFHTGFEKYISKAPGLTYGEIQNVVSVYNGREVKGIIYALLSTPKMLKEEPIEITYEKIKRLCEKAEQEGAKIIGLGAYTKVIGDNGITINKNSPTPVTTGNSLSASATLWGLHEILEKMNLLTKHSHAVYYQGTGMVIGATGSIGKVSALLMSLIFKKLVIVAPRLERLEELKTEITTLSPHCEVIATTNANDFAQDCDALVTATSALDQKIVDVERLKPGCVVCDCSRPLDFNKDDARKRPDILIVESGELHLPGPIKITCDIGLPHNAVYACLAETALLSLEERYESYTLGREIHMDKVKEIYKIARKHGATLSAIQGPMGWITDTEIALVRKLALKKRGLL